VGLERLRRLRDVEEDVVLGGQFGEGGDERLMDLLEELPAGPFGLRLLA
jgi:hypothetical protein